MEYYPRKIEKKLDKWTDRKEIILMKGPRQSGKTTLFQHLKEKHGGSYITLEDEEKLTSFEKNPKEFVKRYIAGNRNILFNNIYNFNVYKHICWKICNKYPSFYCNIWFFNSLHNY